MDFSALGCLLALGLDLGPPQPIAEPRIVLHEPDSLDLVGRGAQHQQIPVTPLRLYPLALSSPFDYPMVDSGSPTSSSPNSTLETHEPAGIALLHGGGLRLVRCSIGHFGRIPRPCHFLGPSRSERLVDGGFGPASVPAGIECFLLSQTPGLSSLQPPWTMGCRP